MILKLYLLFIIIGICIVLFAYLRIEKFENEYNIIYPSEDEIKTILVSKQYFSFFKLMDAQARNIKLDFKDFSEKYTSSIITLTDQEKNKFNTFYKSIVDSIPSKKRHLLLIPNLKIAKFSNIENNFPHTHNDVVFLSQSFIDNLDTPSHRKTLIHEICHIRQRQSPTMYDQLFNQWGFSSISLEYMKQQFPKDIINRIRINPDELPDYRFWVWDQKIVPLVIYSSFNSTNINDVKYIAINWKDKQKYDNLESNEAYNSYFNIGVNHYHPNEILAEYYSKYYIEVIGEGTLQDTDAYQTFKTFINNNNN